MPSGAKKRKAAKKRNEIHSNNNPNPSLAPTQGGGDVKHQDDWQSDAGEASSIASQSHHDLLTRGEEEKLDNFQNVSNLPSVEGAKSEGDHKHDIVVEGIDPPVEKKIRIEDEFDRKNGKFEHDETERKSYDGGSSRSSSSSSLDDESRGIKKSQASDVVEPAFKENEKKGSIDQQAGVSETCKDAAFQQDEAAIPSVEKITVASLDNEADAEKDRGVNEPLLVPPPHPETTSWKGCCGLFELFTGSGR